MAGSLPHWPRATLSKEVCKSKNKKIGPGKPKKKAGRAKQEPGRPPGQGRGEGREPKPSRPPGQPQHKTPTGGTQNGQAAQTNDSKNLSFFVKTEASKTLKQNYEE